MLNGIRADFNSGILNLYNGTRPTDADTALSGNTLLVTLTFNATAFPVAASGVLTANAITSGAGVAAGTATFARSFKSDTTTPLADFSVGTSGTEVVLNTTSIVVAGTVSCTSCTITNPVGS